MEVAEQDGGDCAVYAQARRRVPDHCCSARSSCRRAGNLKKNEVNDNLVLLQASSFQLLVTMIILPKDVVLYSFRYTLPRYYSKLAKK